MNPIAKNVLAVILGIVIGSIVNMSLINLGHKIIALPEGADVSDMEKLKESMALFAPKHFIFPFLAHALGTLVGAFLAAKLATTRPMAFAKGIGGWFLLGGIAVACMLGGPIWFTVLDILFAYLPMAVIGGRLAAKKNRSR